MLGRISANPDDETLLVSQLDGVQLGNKTYLSNYSPVNLLLRESQDSYGREGAETKAKYTAMGLMQPEQTRPSSKQTKSAALLALMPNFPSKDIRDSIIDFYWQSIFRMMQMMDHNSFYEQYKLTFDNAIEPDEPSLDGVPPPPAPKAPHKMDHDIFLMVCHVLIAAGCIYNDHPALIKDGRMDDACKLLHDKANLALTIFWTEPRIEVIQCLLIMSSAAFGEQVRNNMWLYAGAAVRQALGLGMHREFTYTMLGETAKRVRRRTWWLAYCTDKLVAVGTSKPSMIHDADVDTQLPERADYISIAKYPVETDAMTPEFYAQWSRHHIHICQVIDTVVNKLLSPLALRKPPSQDFVTALDMRLTKWYMSVDNEYRWGTEECRRLPQYAILLMAQLNMTFHLTMILLNRRGVESAINNYAQLSTSSSYHSANTSANIILDIIADLRREKLLRYSGSFSIFGTYVAIVQLIVTYRRSTNSSDKNAARNAIYRGLESLWDLRRTWINAGYIAVKIEDLMSKWGEDDAASPPTLTDSSASPRSTRADESSRSPGLTSSSSYGQNAALVGPSGAAAIPPPPMEPTWQDPQISILQRVMFNQTPTPGVPPAGYAPSPPQPVQFDAASLNWQWLDNGPSSHAMQSQPQMPMSQMQPQMQPHPMQHSMRQPMQYPLQYGHYTYDESIDSDLLDILKQQ